MNITRYIVGAIRFLLVWSVVAVVIGYAMVFFFHPPLGEHIVIGAGSSWRNLPGTILGLLAGIQSFRASVEESRKKEGQ
jgi:Na+/H+-dicarboxylate symporter